MKTHITGTTLIVMFCLMSISGYTQVTKSTVIEPMVISCSTVIEPVYSPGLEGNLLGDPSTQPVGVILPPGYELYPKNRYPVVYFLHGIFQKYNGDMNKILPILNYLISDKIITPMILVVPNGENYYGGSFYTNSYVSGNWQDFIVKDVIQHVENKYLILDKPDSRGLSGFSMGGYGSIMIAMQYPSVYSSIVLVDAASMDLDKIFIQGDRKENIIAAACEKEYSSYLPTELRVNFSAAVAFAPDSTAASFCRFPYTCEGEFVDSIWQKWLMHDPISLLPSYQDSLQKLNTLQIYVADQGYLIQANESFHQALEDLDIDHGYEIYSGDHYVDPVIDEMLIHFSENLTVIVPTIRLSSKYHLLKTDTLVVESDKDGKLFIVPKTDALTLESIKENQIYSDNLLVEMKNEYPLSGLDYGRYNIYAVCSDSIVSNIYEEICVVPDTSPPNLILSRDTVHQGDPFHVSCSRDGTIALLSCPSLSCPEFSTVSEILQPPFPATLKDSLTVLEDQEASFSTDKLTPGSYMLYGYDQYGIVSEPAKLQITEGTNVDFSNHPPAIALFPNPVKKILTLKTDKHDPLRVSISSINGKLLYRSLTEGTILQIDLSSFQSGIYFISIRSKDFVTTRKIIKL